MTYSATTSIALFSAVYVYWRLKPFSAHKKRVSDMKALRDLVRACSQLHVLLLPCADSCSVKASPLLLAHLPVQPSLALTGHAPWHSRLRSRPQSASSEGWGASGPRHPGERATCCGQSSLFNEGHGEHTGAVQCGRP